MASYFDDLHDASLVQVKFTWNTGLVDIHLRTSSNPDFLLTVFNVTTFQATRTFEWGPSEQVNSVTATQESVIIEMQSGDIIKVIGYVNLE